MTSKEFYNIMITKLTTRPTSEKTVQKLLNFENINWSKYITLVGVCGLPLFARSRFRDNGARKPL